VVVEVVQVVAGGGGQAAREQGRGDHVDGDEERARALGPAHGRRGEADVGVVCCWRARARGLSRHPLASDTYLDRGAGSSTLAARGFGTGRRRD
jgi:hypothetical protein